MGGHRPARTGARLQGPPRLDHADLRCRGRRHRPDRSAGEADARRGRGSLSEPASLAYAPGGFERHEPALHAQPLLLRLEPCAGRRGAAGRNRGLRGLGGSCPPASRVAFDGGTDETVLRLGRLPPPSARAAFRCGNTSATTSVVTRLASRSSLRDISCRSSHGGTLSASDSRSPVPPMSKVYLVETPDVALHDHQVLRGIARRLGVVGAVAHPDLVHADMRDRRHVTRLARQQQEHAHRLAIGFRHHAGALALRGVRAHAWRRRWSAAEAAEAADRARWNH